MKKQDIITNLEKRIDKRGKALEQALILLQEKPEKTDLDDEIIGILSKGINA